MVYHCLADLRPLAQQLASEQAQRAAEAAAQVAAAQRLHAQQQLFALAVGPVRPLRSQAVVRHPPNPPPPLARQHQHDEAQALQESLSDGFDASALLQTDAALSYRRPGIGPDVTDKLRSGHWSLQRQLDLHGLRTDQARQALAEFLRQAQQQGLRCVRVVHGKGLGSPGRQPVLKGRVHSWLVQKQEVLAFVQARPTDGGAGALLVLLAASHRPKK